ncbi:hypothetical protein [Halosimplex pelagicum]|uniref:Integral membrane protein n=1 Tax=Halosimplex pelagicum TaxID=869886 RepID=A0A7D5PDQ5_9EURY|nr:hypothetical protein [Halosimplex pelagicum]QLH84302.1 hypothetical protein HZS54_22850 [Halosimplex pelagicum]
MVSRDTTVHVTVVALAIAGLAVLSRLTDDPASAPTVVGFVLYNGAVLAGAHLYLAWRGEDGLVPVASRWRFVAAVAAVLALGALVLVTDPVPLGPVSSDALLGATAGVVALAYLVVEARDGYRESTAGGGH